MKNNLFYNSKTDIRKEKNKFYIKFIIIFFIILINFFFFNNSIGASTPKLINTLQKAFESIESWLIKLATPMAAIAVGAGLFMQKFSFGDEEKIRTGKKLVKTSLVSYAFILAIDLVLSAIESLI